MAKFENAFETTMGHEGDGLTDDPLDRGRLTYRGISYRFHPSWAGWRLVIQMKDDPLLLKGSQELKDLVKDFYKAEFWDRFVGDEMPDQEIANEVFDTSVNMGVHQGIKFLQVALSKLNRNESVFKNLAEDGVYGAMTAKALNVVVQSHRDAGILFKMLNVLQGARYLSIMTKSEDQENFARGWFSRVAFRKTRATT